MKPEAEKKTQRGRCREEDRWRKAQGREALKSRNIGIREIYSRYKEEQERWGKKGKEE
jgi:hypothetical protein